MRSILSLQSDISKSWKTMSKSAPCKNCPDRCVACHDRCEKYQAWHAERVELNRQIAADGLIGAPTDGRMRRKTRVIKLFKGRY